MKKIKIEGFNLYGFTGFYESLWNNSSSDDGNDDQLAYALIYYLDIDEDRAYEIIDKMSDMWEYFDYDFALYQKAIIEAYTPLYLEMVSEAVGANIEAVTTTKMTSPREYNFTTDKICVDVEVSDDFTDKLLDKVSENFDVLYDRVRESWSCRSGFISFLDDDLNVWVNIIRGVMPDDGHRNDYIEVLCRYIVELEDNDEYDTEWRLYEVISESCVAYGDYYRCLPKCKELL